jgi:hypothetical protein
MLNGLGPRPFRLRRADRKGGFAAAEFSFAIELVGRRALAGDGLRGL